MGLPRPGAVRRRFVDAFVLGARLLVLETHAYRTEAVAFVGETVTPYNVVLRAVRTADRERASHAEAQLERLLTI